MLGKLRQLIGAAADPAGPVDPAACVRLSVAALLVELSRADHEEHPAEQQAILAMVQRYFQLDDAGAAELLAEARSAVDGSVSLREFTQPLQESMSYQEKQNVVGMLWDIALEDKTLDRYEDYLVGKLADLLYVARGDVIRLRWQASQRRLPRE